MRRRSGLDTLLSALLFAVAAGGVAQEGGAAVPRSPEGTRIINFPSADVPAPGTLGMIFTHRFAQALEDSDWHSLFSFDSGADIGIGISYVPLRNLEVSADRSSNQDDWELALRYRLIERTATFPVALTLRGGANIRTEIFVDRENTYFCQAIASLAVGRRIRLSVLPTYVSRTAGTPFVSLPREDVFNVFGAVSAALSRSVNVQGEVIPRRGRHGSPGVGWMAAVEKTVLRHRFSFTVGNVRNTTVDQYVAPDFNGISPHEYSVGFNLVRSWKLK